MATKTIKGGATRVSFPRTSVTVDITGTGNTRTLTLNIPTPGKPQTRVFTAVDRNGGWVIPGFPAAAATHITDLAHDLHALWPTIVRNA